jgi:hypothetical protein
MDHVEVTIHKCLVHPGVHKTNAGLIQLRGKTKRSYSVICIHKQYFCHYGGTFKRFLSTAKGPFLQYQNTGMF